MPSDLFFNYVCVICVGFVWMYIEPTRGQKGGVRSLVARFSGSMSCLRWILGTEHMSSDRTASSLH